MLFFFDYPSNRPPDSAKEAISADIEEYLHRAVSFTTKNYLMVF